MNGADFHNSRQKFLPSRDHCGKETAPKCLLDKNNRPSFFRKSGRWHVECERTTSELNVRSVNSTVYLLYEEPAVGQLLVAIRQLLAALCLRCIQLSTPLDDRLHLRFQFAGVETSHGELVLNLVATGDVRDLWIWTKDGREYSAIYFSKIHVYSLVKINCNAGQQNAILPLCSLFTSYSCTVGTQYFMLAPLEETFQLFYNCRILSP